MELMQLRLQTPRDLLKDMAKPILQLVMPVHFGVCAVYFGGKARGMLRYVWEVFGEYARVLFRTCFWVNKPTIKPHGASLPLSLSLSLYIIHICI